MKRYTTFMFQFNLFVDLSEIDCLLKKKPSVVFFSASLCIDWLVTCVFMVSGLGGLV